MKRTALALLLAAALTACDDTAGDSPSTTERRSTPAPCTGMPGKPVSSDSYRSGAPDVADDGDELLVTVTVRTRTEDGTCHLGETSLVEIWHTGDDGRYLDDAWRTARYTGKDGTTTYRTVRPRPEENFPHLHVRVTTNGQSEDWVIGITPDTPSELHLELLIGAPGEKTSIVPTGEPQV